MIVFLNGKFIDAKRAAVSVFDHGFLYGDGVYETLRTYNGKIWQSDEHLRRLRNSAGLLKIVLSWSDDQIGLWMQKLLKKNGSGEFRIRIAVTRGQNDFSFLGATQPTLVMIAQKLGEQPSVVYKKGVDVVSLPWKRLLPEAKTISLLPYILAQHHIDEKKAYEGVFLGEQGEVLEGTITNLTAVFGKVLVAPKSGILAGCTQQTVLKLAMGNGLKVERKKLVLRELLKADEVFLTSTVRGIIPVKSVDGKKIGKVCPGQMTRLLMKAFLEYTRDLV